jgi:hypothetical protein
VTEEPERDVDAEAGDEPVAEPKRRRKGSIGQSIGGVLFGFEQQVFRNVPPPHELVHQARPDAPVPAGDGGFMTIELPGLPEAVADAPVPPADPDETDPA